MNNEKVNYQREIEMLVICIFLTYLATNLFGFNTMDMNIWVGRFFECLIFYVMMLPSVVCYKLQKQSFSGLMNTTLGQCALGVGSGLLFAIVFSVINYILDFGRVGYVFFDKMSVHLYYCLFYVFFVAIAEEFIFRIYIQKTFEMLLGKYKILAPFLAAVLFGLYHIINCDWVTVIIAFILGLIWGYIRYFWGNCSFAYLVLVHGFYDFGLYIIGVILFQTLN